MCGFLFLFLCFEDIWGVPYRVWQLSEAVDVCAMRASLWGKEVLLWSTGGPASLRESCAKQSAEAKFGSGSHAVTVIPAELNLLIISRWARELISPAEVYVYLQWRVPSWHDNYDMNVPSMPRNCCVWCLWQSRSFTGYQGMDKRKPVRVPLASIWSVSCQVWSGRNLEVVGLCEFLLFWSCARLLMKLLALTGIFICSLVFEVHCYSPRSSPMSPTGGQCGRDARPWESWASSISQESLPFLAPWGSWMDGASYSAWSRGRGATPYVELDQDRSSQHFEVRSACAINDLTGCRETRFICRLHVNTVLAAFVLINQLVSTHPACLKSFLQLAARCVPSSIRVHLGRGQSMKVSKWIANFEDFWSTLWHPVDRKHGNHQSREAFT